MVQVLHTYFLGSYANLKPSHGHKTTRVFLHESTVIPGGPGTRLQLQNISAPGSQSMRQNSSRCCVYDGERDK